MLFLDINRSYLLWICNGFRPMKVNCFSFFLEATSAMVLAVDVFVAVLSLFSNSTNLMSRFCRLNGQNKKVLSFGPCNFSIVI